LTPDSLWAEAAPFNSASVSSGGVSSGSARHSVLDNIKSQIALLVEENQRLSSEYRSLQQEYADLQKVVKQNENEMREIELESNSRSAREEEQKQLVKTYYEDLDGINNHILIQESQNMYLRGELLDVEESQGLMRFQLADLQNQKRELELQLKTKEFYSEEEHQKFQGEINSLKKKLKSYLEKEEEMMSQIREQEQGNSSLPQSVEKLRQKNEEFNDELTDLQRKKDFKSREVEALEAKRLFLSESVKALKEQKEKERVALQQRLEQLETEYAALNDTVTLVLLRQSVKRKLLDETIKMDKENQILRDRIAGLKEKIKVSSK